MHSAMSSTAQEKRLINMVRTNWGYSKEVETVFHIYLNVPTPNHLCDQKQRSMHCDKSTYFTVSSTTTDKALVITNHQHDWGSFIRWVFIVRVLQLLWKCGFLAGWLRQSPFSGLKSWLGFADDIPKRLKQPYMSAWVCSHKFTHVIHHPAIVVRGHGPIM